MSGYMAVVFDTSRPGHWLENEIILNTWPATEEWVAEEAALTWINRYPEDIAIVVKVETNVCKHCDQPIREKLGWIVHRWTHTYGDYYVCLGQAATRAEPKEET